MKNNKGLHRKILFALLMGCVTTGIISFTLITINIGFGAKFLSIWLKSWGIAYMVCIPIILIVGAQIQRLVERMIPIENK